MHTQIQAVVTPIIQRQNLRLFQMVPGGLFRVTKAADGIPAIATSAALALMHNHGAPVSDNARIWVSVVCCNPHEGLIGEFFGLPRDIEVQRVHSIAPWQLTVSEH